MRASQMELDEQYWYALKRRHLKLGKFDLCTFKKPFGKTSRLPGKGAHGNRDPTAQENQTFSLRLQIFMWEALAQLCE